MDGNGAGIPSVLGLTVFDDGSGQGPALYAGGLFTSALDSRDSFAARWSGCPQLPPRLFAIIPSSGFDTGGSDVNLIGEHFTVDTAVHFAGTPAPAVTFVSTTELRAIAPPHPLPRNPSRAALRELVDVAVQNENGRDVLNKAYLYKAR